MNKVKTKKESMIPQELGVLNSLELDKLSSCRVFHAHLSISSNGLGEMINVPIMIMKGKKAEPIVGITAAVHGNELNGLPIIHELFRTINPLRLQGTIVGIPVVNIPGFHQNIRSFSDGKDINRIFPGKKDGNCSEFYAHQFVTKVIPNLNYLVDLHTASFGRINSLYVRADLESPVTKKMAVLQHPQIIVNKEGDDGTLRDAAKSLGVHSITVEVGNPSLFQRRLINKSLLGLNNILSYLKMVPRPEKMPQEPPIICQKSYWIYADQGGILEVVPGLVEFVKKGDLIARIKDVFGRTIKNYHAPEDGVVVGKSTNPVGLAGARILHLGIVQKSKKK